MFPEKAVYPFRYALANHELGTDQLISGVLFQIGMRAALSTSMADRGDQPAIFQTRKPGKFSRLTVVIREQHAQSLVDTFIDPGANRV